MNKVFLHALLLAAFCIGAAHCSGQPDSTPELPAAMKRWAMSLPGKLEEPRLVRPKHSNAKPSERTDVSEYWLVEKPKPGTPPTGATEAEQLRGLRFIKFKTMAKQTLGDDAYLYHQGKPMKYKKVFNKFARSEGGNGKYYYQVEFGDDASVLWADFETEEEQELQDAAFTRREFRKVSDIVHYFVNTAEARRLLAKYKITTPPPTYWKLDNSPHGAGYTVGTAPNRSILPQGKTNTVLMIIAGVALVIFLIASCFMCRQVYLYVLCCCCCKQSAPARMVKEILGLDDDDEVTLEELRRHRHGKAEKPNQKVLYPKNIVAKKPEAKEPRTVEGKPDEHP